MAIIYNQTFYHFYFDRISGRGIKYFFEVKSCFRNYLGLFGSPRDFIIPIGMVRMGVQLPLHRVVVANGGADVVCRDF